MTGVSKKAVSKLLVDAGRVCTDYQDRVFRNLRCKRLQLDELWGFNYCKQKTVTPEIASKVEGAGDVWLWVAIDADTKLVPSWLLGDRSLDTASVFVDDLASRLTGRAQVTTDGHRAYLDALEGAFGSDVDYAVLQKLYGSAGDAEERRYSPARVRGVYQKLIKGSPDPRHVSTSFVERHNWTIRTMMRRYTRLSNGFSRKLENHAAAVALTYFAYNFIKIHRTLRMSPAMAAGVTEQLWEVSDLVALLEVSESKKAA